MSLGNNVWTFLSIALYLTSFYFFFKCVKRGGTGTFITVFIVVISFIFSLLSGGYLVADWFTGVGFDDSVFYHLKFGVKGADFSDFYFLMLLFACLQLMFLVFIIKYIKKFISSQNQKINWVALIEGAIMVFCAFFCAPATSNLFVYVFTAQDVEDFSAYFIKPQIPTSVGHPKNIIYFYLESLEKNYMNEDLFPGLLPELHKIESESVSFSNVGQTVGANWTIAGMVSSQCGLPLLSLFTNNNFHMDNFMPNALCLGDILKSQGYHLEFMGGAETEFSGKGLFYSNHGFSNIQGKSEFLKEHIGEDYINNWGIYDDTLYEMVIKRVRELRKSVGPWGLFSINIGTHQPEGFLARQCKDFKYRDGSDNLLNAVHCTDRLLGQIYKKLKDEGVLNDTVAVFASDHLAPVMVKTYDTLNKVDRHNLLMVTGAGVTPGKNNRTGTTLDISPTLLNYLQFGSHPIALGRDLNGNLPTLAERLTYQTRMDLKLFAWRTVIDMSFWGYPELKGNITLDSQSRQIYIGDDKIKYPSLIRYTPTGKIEEIYYGNEHPEASEDNLYLPAYYLANGISNNQLFLWVDTCRTLSTLNRDLRKFDQQYCFYNGSLSSKHSTSGLVSTGGGNLIIQNEVGTDFSVEQAKNYRQKLQNLNLIRWDTLHLLSESTSIFPSNELLASGSDSVIKKSAISGIPVEESGLTLARVVYKPNSNAGVTSYIDNLGQVPVCDKTAAPLQIKSLIKNSPLDNAYKPLFYIVIGTVDVKCQEGILNPPVDLHLQNLSRLTVGTPYIAVTDPDFNIKYENAGQADQMIGLKVTVNDK